MTKHVIENINETILPEGCTIPLGNKKTSLKGGELDGSYTISVTLDVSGMSIGQILGALAKSSSPLVRWQSAQRGSKTRPSASDTTLKELESTGLTVHLNEIDQTVMTEADKREQVMASVATMSQKEKELLLEMLMK